MKTLEQIKQGAVFRPIETDAIIEIVRAVFAEDKEPEKEPEIAKCVCGGQAILQGENLYWVRCSRTNYCWSGPQKPTRSQAVLAWNQVMEKMKAI